MENEAGRLFGSLRWVAHGVWIFVFVSFTISLGQRAMDKNKLIKCAILGGVLSLVLIIVKIHFLGMDDAFPMCRRIGPLWFYAGSFLLGAAAVCLFAMIHKYPKNNSRSGLQDR